ncbi:hypothetical protein Q4519_06980 [Motilimonas sp. 1_MG-2023]|uniref:hypothetical protein n=1 Tax=Motilimonas sp. 1_MG-2023 TaxID=3062672 RepID=UPI0026E1809F|nr:hypothetical protein [Motilimonas sp. 1_MG-2023]MDO6525425.1 hypothetical protein [Motilimonas sp. 1_MG-2023]
MKALAIVALVFAALSIFIPIGGVFIAMLCSVMAMISFRSQPTLSGITFGINILNTAFLSPSILLTDAASSGALNPDQTMANAPTEAGTIYWFYIGFHVTLFIIAITWRLVRGAPSQNIQQLAPQV